MVGIVKRGVRESTSTGEVPLSAGIGDLSLQRDLNGKTGDLHDYVYISPYLPIRLFELFDKFSSTHFHLISIFKEA